MFVRQAASGRATSTLLARLRGAKDGTSGALPGNPPPGGAPLPSLAGFSPATVPVSWTSEEGASVSLALRYDHPAPGPEGSHHRFRRTGGAQEAIRFPGGVRVDSG